MCHQDIKELLLALQDAVTSGDPAQQAIFSPLVLNFKLDWGIISLKDARVFFSSQAPLTYMGHVPTAPRLCHEPCSWKVYLSFPTHFTAGEIILPGCQEEQMQHT